MRRLIILRKYPNHVEIVGHHDIGEIITCSLEDWGRCGWISLFGVEFIKLLFLISGSI